MNVERSGGQHGISAISTAIDAAARCVKCGATHRDGCACWVLLECPKCGDAKTVERDGTDPPGTAKVRTLCPECCGGDFSEINYFDCAGRQIFDF